MNLAPPPGRRVVAFTDRDGRAKFWADTAAPKVIDFQSTPGLRASVLWATPPEARLERGPVPDPVHDLASLHPEPGGTTFLMMTIPPDSIYESPDLDLEAAVAEQRRHLPGVADRMEPDAPGFHATDTVDYAIVMAGQVCLEVDGEEVSLTAGDTVVQLGARHAWRNRSESSATLAFILIGAMR